MDQTVDATTAKSLAAGRLAYRDLGAGIVAFQRQLVEGWIEQGMDRALALARAEQAGHLMREIAMTVPGPDEIKRLVAELGLSEATRRYTAAAAAALQAAENMPRLLFLQPGDEGVN